MAHSQLKPVQHTAHDGSMVDPDGPEGIPNSRRGYRPTIMGTRHMAASTHYLATYAAAHIFAQGGNAVDAGVAACLALTVVETHRANLGGVAPILIRTAAGETACIAGLGCWSRRATLAEVRSRWGGDLPWGIARSVVPAAVSAYLVALEHFGTLSLATVAAPARELAANGFPVQPSLHTVIGGERASLERWPSSRQVFLPGGRVPRTGETLRQRELAGLFDMLVQAERDSQAHGREAGLRAAHQRFYQGDIALRMVQFVRAEGGFLDEEDLASFRAPVEKPARVRFGDYEVLECGPWSQGPVLLQALKMLEPFGPQAFHPTDLDAVHLRIEALKLAFADREAYYGDPAFVNVPLHGLLSPGYAAERRALIDQQQAAPGLPAPGNPWPYNDKPGMPASPRPFRTGSLTPPADTTYAAAADASGTLFSATPSDPTIWSPLVPGLGIIVSPRGTQTWLEEDHPSGLQPGKRPRLTPNPALVLRDGRPFMALGTPGGDTQCQAMLQVLGAVVGAGWDLQAAIESPRAITFSAPNSFWPHEAQPGVVWAETRLGAETLNGLRQRGHRVEEWSGWERNLAGTVCAVQCGEDGLRGAADPRRDAYAIGW